MIQGLLKKDKITLKDAVDELTSLNYELKKISEITGQSITEIEALQNQ